MNLIVIVLATLAAGIGSVWIAALFMRCGVEKRLGGMGSQYLLSLSAGALLATAFLHLLPEAFESQISVHNLFTALVAGLVFFFLLDKAELWHHGHEHGHAHGQGHGHDHSDTQDNLATAHHHHPAATANANSATHAASISVNAANTNKTSGSWTILAGDSVHCFGDGILIASAMVADVRLGLIAALAVLVHEVPHHMGDLVVLGQGGAGRRKALVKVSRAGSMTVLGGLAGYFLLAELHDWLPYFLVVASSSFIYVALADLIPQLQRRLTFWQTAAQVAWLLAGLGLVMVHTH